MPNNLPSINFAGNKQDSLFERIMNWTLTIGRLIVIMVEIVAVAAFIYRFTLDDKLANLRSAIRDRKEEVSSKKNDEDKYRNLQTRIALVSELSAKAAKSNQTITDITNLIPATAKNKNLVFSSNQVGINTNVLSISSLKELMDPLKGYSGVDSISINNIENKPSSGLSVNISITVK